MPEDKQLFSVRVYRNTDIPHRRDLCVYLDPDHKHPGWLLVVDSQSWTDLLHSAAESVADRIKAGLGADSDIPVFIGNYGATLQSWACEDNK